VCDCIGQHAGDTWEPDECWSHAKPLVAGVAQEHSINPAGDKDWFVFSLDKASDVTFKVWGAAGYLNVYWYGPDNAAVELDYNSGYLAGSGFTLSRTNLPVGKYWFRAGSSSLIGSYDVLLTVNAVAPGVESPDAGNDASTAQILPSGVTQEHVIKPSGDKDWYTVTLDQASDVGFKIWGPSGYMSVYWYGPDDSTVELDYNSGNLAGSGFTLSRTNLPVGKYWFRAGSSSLIGSYSVLLTVKTVAPGVENPDAGNDSSTAQPLVSGVAQEHVIKPQGDKDWFVVALGQASNVDFKLWGPSGYMTVYEYGPDSPTQSLDHKSGYLDGSGFTLSGTNLPAGMYWFKAYSSDLVGSYYVLLTVKAL
jgi:hypothetical protein